MLKLFIIKPHCFNKRQALCDNKYSRTQLGSHHNSISSLSQYTPLKTITVNIFTWGCVVIQSRDPFQGSKGIEGEGGSEIFSTTKKLYCQQGGLLKFQASLVHWFYYVVVRHLNQKSSLQIFKSIESSRLSINTKEYS